MTAVSFTTMMPDKSRPWRFSRFSAARLAVSGVGPAYWSATTSWSPGQRSFSAATKPCSRMVVLAEPSWYRSRSTRPLPFNARPSASAPMPPLLTLSVATKLTTWSESRAESMITVGVPRRFASSTGRTRAFASSGARTMPSMPWLAKLSTTCTCCSRSSSRSGPFHVSST